MVAVPRDSGVAMILVCGRGGGGGVGGGGGGGGGWGVVASDRQRYILQL